MDLTITKSGKNVNFDSNLNEYYTFAITAPAKSHGAPTTGGQLSGTRSGNDRTGSTARPSRRTMQMQGLFLHRKTLARLT